MSDQDDERRAKLEEKRLCMARIRSAKRFVITQLKQELNQLMIDRDILMLTADQNIDQKKTPLAKMVAFAYELEDENESMRREIQKYRSMKRIVNRGVASIWSIRSD